jgi:hypothetical protein
VLAGVKVIDCAAVPALGTVDEDVKVKVPETVRLVYGATAVPPVSVEEARVCP